MQRTCTPPTFPPVFERSSMMRKYLSLGSFSRKLKAAILQLYFKLYFRSILPEVFCKKGVHKNFAKYRGKHLCWSHFSNKDWVISSFNESLFKMIWNAFYFAWKALFVLKIFKFLSWIFVHVEKRLDSKDKINFKFYDIKTWLTKNCGTHIVQYLS